MIVQYKIIGSSDGTCGGDSGGPIVQFETEAYKTPRWVQIGKSKF